MLGNVYSNQTIDGFVNNRHIPCFYGMCLYDDAAEIPPEKRGRMFLPPFILQHPHSVHEAGIPPITDDDMIHKIYPHKLTGVLKL